VDEKDALGTVDVASLEGEPFLRAQAGASGEDRDHSPGPELLGHGLDFLPRLEGADLLPLRERVGNVASGVLVEHLPAHGCIENLAERDHRIVAMSLRETLRPDAELIREKVMNGNITEGSDRLGEHGAETRDRCGRGLVLGKVTLDQLGQCPVPAGGDKWPKAGALKSSVKRLSGLALRLEAGDLTPAAVLVAVAAGPRAGRLLERSRAEQRASSPPISG
jgi:hypothetical protein